MACVSRDEQEEKGSEIMMRGDIADFTGDEIAMMIAYFDNLARENYSSSNLELFNGPPDEKRDDSGKWTNAGGSSQRKGKITVESGLKELNDTSLRMFGRKVNTKELTSLSGAPDGADVEIYPDQSSIRISWWTDQAQGIRSIYKSAAGSLIMHNEQTKIDPEDQGQGIGIKVFNTQIEQAQKFGVKRIENEAKRDDEHGWIGYNVWPKFGYDGYIPRSVGGGKGPNKERKISQLMATSEGRAWWKKNGTTTNMEFDLSPNSHSMKTWEAYKRLKGIS